MDRRWITNAARKRLNALLSLNDFDGQDWDMECADRRGLLDFVTLYENGDLDADERFALMSLIVASLDDQLAVGPGDPSVEARIRRHLTTDFELHESTVRYWSLVDDTDSTDGFHATPFMRAILSERA